MSYAFEQPLAIHAEQSERAAFIRRTYAHLAGAILAFVAIEFAIFSAFSADEMRATMMRVFASPLSNLILLAAFIGVGWVARMWAYSGSSQAMQYAGLALYVVFEAIIFVPILYVAVHWLNQPSLVGQAGVMTLAMFGGLTAAVLTTRADFSFMRNILIIGSFLMLGFCIAGMFLPMGFNLGLIYSFCGVALACGFILYDTSNVLHHFRTDAHVAAALELFASVAYLFYHILRILIMLSGGRNNN